MWHSKSAILELGERSSTGKSPVKSKRKELEDSNRNKLLTLSQLLQIADGADYKIYRMSQVFNVLTVILHRHIYNYIHKWETIARMNSKLTIFNTDTKPLQNRTLACIFDWFIVIWP